MFGHRIYYAAKPYIPRSLRLGLRRAVARWQRSRNAAIWPIDAAAAKKPVDWPGWPQPNTFAFVITHDVESAEGIAKCRQLAELEMELGFRSCFNFIPEGPYAVPPDLRTWLVDHGFEVGVHDLQHDGYLFDSRANFDAKAERINHYLRAWAAAGFRAGFMLRNLDWLHQLDISYDASTFDTDPFEPQPEGVGTIFPFWIPTPSPAVDAGKSSPSAKAGGREGYVELPYSLPQDSTLYLILGEKTPEIWLKKVDWIARNGGMALINVHPDYLQFPDAPAGSLTFPLAHYTSLLRHIQTIHAGKVWLPLPRDLAQWYQNTVRPRVRPPAPPATFARPASHPPSRISSLGGKRAAVLLYSNYPADPRPRRAAEAMIEAGMEVDLLCLAETKEEPLREVVGGVRVFRIRMKRRRASAWNYLLQYGLFIFSSFWFLFWRSWRRKYDVVHVHNMPDILVFSALTPKLLGAKVLLDLHDPMPELMTSIFGVAPGSLKIRVLKTLEKWSLGFANSVVTVNRACQKIFSARSCPPEKIRVVMNSPDESIFRPPDASSRRPASRADGSPFVIMYHGSLVERHGLDLAVAAVARVLPTIPGIELRIYGQRTPFLDKVMATVPAAKLEHVVRFLGSKSQEEIAQAILDCDVGIIPNRRSIFTELNTPTRIFEYLAQMRPVIAPRAPGILDYFGPDDLIYFELGNLDELAEKILYAYREPAAVARSLARGYDIYLNHCWSQERRRFVNLVADMLNLAREPDDEPAVAEITASRGGG